MIVDAKSVNGNGLFGSLHALLQVLYRRDCRRSYTPPGHWLARDIRFSVFMADLDRGKKGPHVCKFSHLYYIILYLIIVFLTFFLIYSF